MTRRTILVCLGLGLLTLGLFYRAANFPFIALDDPLYVTGNPHVLGGVGWSNLKWAFTTMIPYWHPLTWISHMFDSDLFGKNPAGPHFVNVLLHAVNTVLVFWILSRLTNRVWCAVVAALLFAVHPLRVESVAWVAERKDVLSAFFFLLGLGAYDRYVKNRTTMAYGAVSFCLLLGLLAKPMLVTFPFVLLLLDYWPLGRLSRKALPGLLLEKLPFFLLSMIFSIVTFNAQRSIKAVMPLGFQGVLPRVEHALISYERYLGKILWPNDLVLPYPFFESVSPWELGWALLLLVGITSATLKLRHERLYLLVGWLWFIGTLIPVIGLVQAGAQGMADRFSYIPSIGVIVAVTWLMADLAVTWRVPAYATGLLVAAVVAVLAWFTSLQLSYWKSGEVLFRHSLAINPTEVVSLFNLASEYAAQNRMAEAIPCLESLLHQTPNDGAVHFHLGQALESTGDKGSAASQYELATGLGSSEGVATIIGALNNLAWIRATSSDPSLRDGEEAVRLASRSGELSGAADANQLDTLAASYAEAGDFASAIVNATHAVEIADAGGDKDLVHQIQERLDLYVRQQSYHESK